VPPNIGVFDVLPLRVPQIILKSLVSVPLYFVLFLKLEKLWSKVRASSVARGGAMGHLHPPSLDS